MIKVPVFVSLLAFSLIFGLILTGCSSDNTSKLKVVTSTSLTENIVKQLGGNHVEVDNLVPPNQHPGNFDVKPGDIQKIANARVFILHGWPGEGFANKLISSASNPNLTVIKVNLDGNWMIPSIQLAAVDKVTFILSDMDESNTSAYERSAAAYKNTINNTEASLKDR
jgi:zinc transport system substrate-binding protein